MRPVWLAARAAVRRRRLQTITIGIVILLSTATIVVALGLLDASTAPFDRAFDRQRGAHLAATFEPGGASRYQIVATATRAGITASAGPFDLAEIPIEHPDWPGRLTVVGRADPGGPVDELAITSGRWVTGPGEIVLADDVEFGFLDKRVGAQVPVSGSGPLTVVGHARSIGRSAVAWVVPAEVARFGATGTQMLYRLADGQTEKQLSVGASAIIAELPAGAAPHFENYLNRRRSSDQSPIVPFLLSFGVLGLVVAVLIIANVVSGAVIAGYRHIGIIKALGFTNRQVIGVYLVMIMAPAGLGCAVGVVLGNLLAQWIMAQAFAGLGVTATDVAPWIDVLALVGVPVVVALAALLPALRAGRLPASEAIRAGSGPRGGRGLRAHRWLSDTRLPRPVSLGLALPFARPGRAGLTLAAVLFGVTSVTFAVGLHGTFVRLADGAFGDRAVRVVPATDADGRPRMADAEVQSRLRSLPGTARITAETHRPARVAGVPNPVSVSAQRGDSAAPIYQMISGRWFNGPGEAVVAPGLRTRWGKSVGDTLSVTVGDTRTEIRIVGEVYLNPYTDIATDWSVLATTDPELRPGAYLVGLAPGTTAEDYATRLFSNTDNLSIDSTGMKSDALIVLTGLVATLTLIVATFAALGVFNTVVLNTRERGREIGILKSIGMTPRQVVATIITSMAALGLVGGVLGIPAGVAAHRVVVPAIANAAQDAFPPSWTYVYSPLVLLTLSLAGVAIAVVGALVPAGWAARTRIANVLHTE